MKDYSKYIADLSPEKRDLFLKRLMEKRPHEAQIQLESQKRDEALLPLSFAQQQLWFMDQLAPGSSLYNMPEVLHFEGTLHSMVVEQSLSAIVDRHEILRTIFLSIEGQPKQVVMPELSMRLPIVDLQGLARPLRNATLSALITQEAWQPFNLTQGPLIRVMLLRLSPQEHVLLITMHHIVSDGWSQSIFKKELSALYTAFSTKKTIALPELPIQYADFTIWQRNWLQGKVLEKLQMYWKQQLVDIPPALQLPTDLRHQKSRTFMGATRSFVLSSRLTRALQELSRQENVTIFMTMLAAFNVLLYRYTGQFDIVLGTDVAGRTYSEMERLIGFFVNQLVLRTDLSGTPSFRDLLGRVREMTLRAYAHQDMPFEKLVEELHPDRTSLRNPLFQVAFFLQNAPSSDIELPELDVHHVAVENKTSKFDLTLFVLEKGDKFTIELEYSLDIFTEGTIERLSRHFHHLLENIVTHPEMLVSELPLLTEQERSQLLVEWNQADQPFSQYQCFHRLFEMQVEKTPDAIAVTLEDQHMTYQGLNRSANSVAHNLLKLGVGPETIVAVLAKRDCALLTVLLAIYKAGGAYLPLDPDDPSIRLQQKLEHSQCHIILAECAFTSLLSQALVAMPAASDIRYSTIEDLLLERQPQENMSFSPTEHQLAYVMYTSGSTGTPKGVMIEQGGMVNHLQAKISALGLTQEDSVAQNASQCFDISIWQFLAALLVGGRVHIFDEQVIRDPSQLLLYLTLSGVSIFEIVPSILQIALEEVEHLPSPRLDLKQLRWLISTGEKLTPELCQRWLRLYQAIPLLNTYGATECSDDVTHYPIYHPLAETEELPAMGRLPIANMQKYILDQNLEPVPIGVWGEVYFGGIGVGRGYLKDAQHTAEVFLADPFSSEPGKRLYKTGDLACYRPDGGMIFLGRIDHQVKVRGYRIELGEIESVLSRHPAVREAVAVVREDASGNDQLIAYVVLYRASAIRVEALQHYVADTLPDYMVPSLCIVLDAFPLNTNGKVDRKKLPLPSANALQREEEFVAPSTPFEKIVSAIWRQVLGVERVGIYDNFFALGGHSLLAPQALSRLRRIFQVEIPLRTLFEFPTVEALANDILSRVAPEQIERIADSLREVETMPTGKTIVSSEKGVNAQ